MEDYETILQQITHRYYPLPGKPWKYFQRWKDVLMLHWQINPEYLAEMLPAGITLDTYDGKAWISLVVFVFDVLRLRKLKFPQVIGLFNEINLRTYVIKDSIPGIYMFSVETDKLLVAWFNRFLVGVRYTKSDI
jgi:uncharacterized protein YqjF (DUF2071 family)